MTIDNDISIFALFAIVTSFVVVCSYNKKQNLLRCLFFVFLCFSVYYFASFFVFPIEFDSYREIDFNLLQMFSITGDFVRYPAYFLADGIIYFVTYFLIAFFATMLFLRIQKFRYAILLFFSITIAYIFFGILINISQQQTNYPIYIDYYSMSIIGFIVGWALALLVLKLAPRFKNKIIQDYSDLPL